jgi:hypothetical protein
VTNPTTHLHGVLKYNNMVRVSTNNENKVVAMGTVRFAEHTNTHRAQAEHTNTHRAQSEHSNTHRAQAEHTNTHRAQTEHTNTHRAQAEHTNTHS